MYAANLEGKIGSGAEGTAPTGVHEYSTVLPRTRLLQAPYLYLLAPFRALTEYCKQDQLEYRVQRYTCTRRLSRASSKAPAATPAGEPPPPICCATVRGNPKLLMATSRSCRVDRGLSQDDPMPAATRPTPEYPTKSRKARKKVIPWWNNVPPISEGGVP